MHWTRHLRLDAYSAVKDAIAEGRLEPLTDESVCVDCGDVATIYEHRNYFYPLLVEPVCRACNNKRGEAYPPAQGPPKYSNGFKKPAGGGGWNYLLTETSERKETGIAVRVKGSGAMWEPIEWDDSLKLAFEDLRKYKYSLPRGDWRCEFFKQHDPYFSEYA